jgi:hypothetical protein
MMSNQKALTNSLVTLLVFLGYQEFGVQIRAFPGLLSFARSTCAAASRSK